MYKEVKSWKKTGLLSVCLSVSLLGSLRILLSRCFPDLLEETKGQIGSMLCASRFWLVYLGDSTALGAWNVNKEKPGKRRRDSGGQAEANG